MTRSQARAIAIEMARDALTGVVGAIERERARKRLEACTEKTYHSILATEGPRFWRPWHRMMARRMDARCRASKLAVDNDTGLTGRCPAVTAMHTAMRDRGIA